MNQVTVQSKNKIIEYLENPKFKEQLKTVLPKYLTPERMVRIALTELRSIPKLMECHPLSFIGAIIRCAQMGLEPSSELGHVYLIPFFNGKTKQQECKIMIGYKGMLYLASKAHIHMETGVISANDKFECEKGLEPKLKHIPHLGPKSDMVGVYALARFQDPSIQPIFEFMNKHEIDDIMVRAVQGKSSTPWQTDYEAMARKTIIRRLFKYLPMSEEIEYAVATDEQADKGTQNHASLIDDTLLDESIESTSNKAEILATMLEKENGSNN
jgi:recombination protein RecT